MQSSRWFLVLIGVLSLYAAVGATMALSRNPVEPPGKPQTFGAAPPVQPSTLTSNPWFKVAAWWIDPANSSGCAADTNDCQAASGSAPHCPCLTYNQIVTRWGTYQPQLGQNTILHWLSSSSGDADPVHFDPQVQNGANISLIGSSSVSSTVTLGAGGSAKNYSSNQALVANLTASGAAGQYLVNTTHTSSAWSYANVTANNFTITQPLTSITFGSVPTEVDTWSASAGGDSVQITTLPSINLIEVNPIFESGLQNVFVQNLKAIDPTGNPGSTPLTIGPYVFLTNFESARVVRVLRPTAPSFQDAGGGGNAAPSFTAQNCAFDGGVIMESASDLPTTTGPIFGGYIKSAVTNGASVLNGSNPDGDIILQAGTAVQNSHWGLVYLDSGSIFIREKNLMGPANYGGGNNSGLTVYGPGTMQLSQPGGALTYAGAAGQAVATFLMTGGFKIGGSSTTSCSVGTGPGPASWNCGITVTPTALDAPVGASGFGGSAISRMGTIITNRSNP